MVTTNQLIADELLSISKDRGTSPIAKGIAGFLGARARRDFEREKQKDKEQLQFEDQISAERLAESIFPDLSEDLRSDIAAGGADALRKILIAQQTKAPEKPVTLSAGETLFTPEGEQLAQVPETGLKKAQARKFNLEADKLEKQLKGGVSINDPKIFDQTSKLRREFTGLSKDFIVQRDAFGRVKASAIDPSAAGDIALIFNFMKTLDPGSVVREGEFATAQNSGGVPETIRARYNKILTGERLTPKIRKDFVTRATKLFDQAQRQHDKRVGTFTTLAQRSGLPADQIVLDLGIAQGVPEAPASTGQAETGQLPAAQAAPDQPAVDQGVRRLKFNPTTGTFE